MKKKPELIYNQAGGIDLIAERDSGNPVRILTGKPSVSKNFWENLLECAETALEDLKYKKDN